MSERWKAVVGFEGYYEVSSLGAIRGVDRSIRHPRGGLRLWKGRTLIASPMSNGYLEISLCRDGEIHVRTVHSVVAEAFHGPCPLGHEVAHGNGDRHDSRESNLSWKTRKANHADKIAHGTTNRGMQHGNAKLTDSGVLRIRAKAARGLTHEAIAIEAGCSTSNVSRILRGEMWSHVR